MGAFNYTNLHIFDKRGVEIPLNYISGVDVRIPNEYGDDAEFYVVTNPDGGVDGAVAKNFGGRYRNLSERSTVKCVVTTQDGKEHKENIDVVTKEYVSYPETYRYIKAIDSSSMLRWTDVDPSDLPYPSVTFVTRVPFARVSTELIETESLYMLVEEDGVFKLPSESSECVSWSNRYDIIFYIDCRRQTDFRTFTVNSDTLVWSDRQTINLANTNAVHVGFTGENEGVYEQSMFMCIYDKTGTNDVYPVGEFIMEAEAVGEDERYRTLFTNFGIPDPKEYGDVFNDRLSLDDKTDNIALNEHSKKVFLSYTDIFPYVGSYKALINAVKMLGYDDIFFKEWYKDISKTSGYENGYVSYDIDYKSDSHANIISNTPIEERIQLRKLNWLSMMYHINKEIYDSPEDAWGFPAVEKHDMYYSPDIIAKLMSLRKWLEKYIIGVHCRIIDVGGEGVYFERYKMSVVPGYQTVTEYESHMDVSPEVLTPITYVDGSGAEIRVRIDDALTSTTIEDVEDMRFVDLCDGYLDASCTYMLADASIDDDGSLYIGRTFSMSGSDNEYEIKASGRSNGFIFSKMNGFVSSGPSILIDDNRFIQMPSELADASSFTTTFTKLPVIAIEVGSLRTVEGVEVSDSYSMSRNLGAGTNTFIFKVAGDDGYEKASSDVLTLIPGSDAEFGMSIDNPYRSPQFYVSGYVSANAIDDASFAIGTDRFDLDILDGKIMFNDPSNDRRIAINISGDGTMSETSISADLTYIGGRTSIYTYSDASSDFTKFSPGAGYAGFKERYDTDASSAVGYDTEISMNILNSGEYTVEVICKDSQNGMHIAKADKTVTVATQDTCMGIISSSQSDDEFDGSISEILDNDDTCIFEYLPKGYVTSAGVDSSTGELSIDASVYTNYCNMKGVIGTTQLSELGYPASVSSWEGDGKVTISFMTPCTGLVGIDASIAADVAAEYALIDASAPFDILDGLAGDQDVPTDTDFDINVIVYDCMSELAVRQYPAMMVTSIDDDITIGYIRFSDVVSSDEISEMENMLATDRYTMHIQPTWLSQVIISECDEDNGTITCEYTNEYHTERLMKSGDVARLTIINRNNPTAVAGCAYKVAEDNNTVGFTKLEGMIDEQYVGSDREDVYCKMDDSTGYSVSEDGHLMHDGEVVKVGNRTVAAMQIEGDPEIYAAVYYLNDSGTPMRVYLQSTKEYSAKLRLSYAHLSYANYTVKESTEMSDRREMINRIVIPNTKRNENLIHHIDTTFMVSTREFNTEDAHATWMDTSSLSDMESTQLYTSHRPIAVDLSSDGTANIIAVADIDPIMGSSAIAYTRWRLYRRTKSSDAELILDVYNRNLCICAHDTGIYDIELIVYDVNGNRHSRMFSGAFTVK